MKNFNFSKKGYVTITVLILMMVLVAASYLFADAIFTELVIARNNKGSAVAFSMAEAGVQEAIYQVQHDSDAGGTRDTFINTTGGTTTLPPNSALISGGSYQVKIQNTAKGVATITSVGQYTIGTRTAKREIKVGIAQAAGSTPYPYDGTIFGSGGAGESIADLDFWFAPVHVFGGSIFSNRDINLKFGSDVDVEGKFDPETKTFSGAVQASDDITISSLSHLDCNCLINDDGDPETLQCSPPPGCSYQEGVATRSMPPIDFDSDSPNSYRNRAKSIPGPSPDGNQYFTKQKDFKALIPKFGSKTFSGVVYIDEPLDIDWGRTINMNGVLATSGSITITLGQLFLAPPPGGGPSGVLSQKSFIVGTLGNFSGTGLVYTGDRAEIDASIGYTMNLTGGILSRRTWISGFRTVNLYFNTDVINTVLANPADTPVIEINHWEEEY